MKRALVFAFFFLCCAWAGYSQCQAKVTLVSYDEGSPTAGDGTIRIQLQANAHYKIQLLQSTDKTNEKLVKEISASGTQLLVFDQLDESRPYRITAEFEGEPKPICRKRGTDQLVLAKSKQ